MEKQIKEIIRSIIREEFVKEMSQNDIHFKAIMKFYDKGTSNAKKAISLYCCAKPNATRQQIAGELMDMGYGEIKDVMKHFKLKIEYVDKKGVEHVAAALPQTEEEPVNEAKVIDIVDRFHDLKLPNIVYLNKKPYTGTTFVMNGYNGYTSAKGDGWVYDSKTRKPLTDKQGNVLRATTHRGAKWDFKNGIKESVKECKTC